ncbi:MAG: hypothetical protein ACI9HA_003807 [Dinoroseobacter sp.]|jgi:hypothetical protein
MWMEPTDVITIQQPVQLLTVQGHHLTLFIWPQKAPLLQPLISHDKTIALPVQNLNLVPVAIDEDKQSAGEGVLLQRLLDNHRQPIDGFAEVDGLGVQQDLLNRVDWSNHDSTTTASFLRH